VTCNLSWSSKHNATQCNTVENSPTALKSLPCFQVDASKDTIGQRARLLVRLDGCQGQLVQVLQRLEASQQSLQRAEEHEQLLESVAGSWKDADSGEMTAGIVSTNTNQIC
jgi:hypothetical protein